jgi:RNA polymerase sigma-70 factor (ECF subfamily)
MQTKKEMADKVRAAMQQLSQRQIEIIRMKFFENKSYEEISALTTTTPRTIYNQVYDSLKILRKCLRVVLFF